MKHLYAHILLAVFCIASFSVSAQQQTDGFWGIPFRSTKAEALKVTKAKKIKPETDKDDWVSFYNVKFGGETAASVILNFHKGLFQSGIVTFKYPSATLLLEHYKDWKADLQQKYGEPYENLEKKPSYLKSLDGDVMLEYAIKNGELKYSSLWKLKDATTGGSTVVYLFVNEEVELILMSADKLLNEQQRDERKKGESKDY